MKKGMSRCPNCKGLGVTKQSLMRGAIYNGCGFCKETGQVSKSKKEKMVKQMPYLAF